jgi:uncharacterized protein YndB with AHSA1/START domain
MTGGRRVTIEVTIAAPSDEVRGALREPRQIARWFGWDYDGLEAEIDQIFVSGAQEEDDPRRLDTGDGTFELEPLEGGPRHTLVRVTRAEPSGDVGADEMYEAIDQGWITFVQQLRFALERHPGQDRRTVYLSNGTGDPVEALGLDRTTLPPGDRYTARLPWGDELAGESFFSTDRQLGLTVDGWGDGLLVLGGGGGGATAILTTYGLDDDAFDALERRWTAGWESSRSAAP